MNTPRRRDMPVLEFVADALFGIGCMIVGLGGLCTVILLGLAPASLSNWAQWSPLAGTFVVGGAVILAGRALRRFVRARVRKLNDE